MMKAYFFKLCFALVLGVFSGPGSLGGNVGIQPTPQYSAGDGYKPGGACPSYQSNCITDCRMKCYTTHIEVELEFQRYFTGVIYIWGNYETCTLYSPADYMKGSKVVSFKVTSSTCPSYEGFQEIYPEGYVQKPKKYEGRSFQIVVQFDPYIVSHEDVNFVARCDTPEEGQRSVFFSYTVLDQYPILIQGMSSKSKLSVEVKKGTSAYGPDLYGPVKIGSFLTLVLKLHGYSKEYDMRVASCWALEGSPVAKTYTKNYGGKAYTKARSIELVRNDCSVKGRIIANFENIGTVSTKDAYDYSYTIIKAATLKAFRFPKSDNVVIRCKVDVCYGSCVGHDKCYPIVLNPPAGQMYLGYSKPEPTVIPKTYEIPYGPTVNRGSSDDEYVPYVQPAYEAQSMKYDGAQSYPKPQDKPQQMPTYASQPAEIYEKMKDQAYPKVAKPYLPSPKPQSYKQPEAEPNLYLVPSYSKKGSTQPVKLMTKPDYMVKDVPPYASEYFVPPAVYAIEDKPADKLNDKMNVSPVGKMSTESLSKAVQMPGKVQKSPMKLNQASGDKMNPMKGKMQVSIMPKGSTGNKMPSGGPTGRALGVSKSRKAASRGGRRNNPNMMMNGRPMMKSLRHRRDSDAIGRKVAGPIVDSYIIEQEFNLAGLSEEIYYNEMRFRRSPDGSPTIQFHNASIWADCKDNSVSLKLEKADGFTGKISVQAWASSENQTCSASRELSEETNYELVINTKECDLNDDLFIAKIESGDDYGMEMIDCYTEELLVADDSMGSRRELMHSGEYEGENNK